MTKFVLRVYMLAIPVIIIGLYFLKMRLTQSESNVKRIQKNFDGRTTGALRVTSDIMEFNLTHTTLKTDSFSSTFMNELCNVTLLNNTRLARKEILVFNRVSKVGSTSIMALIRHLVFRNQFRCYISGKRRFGNVELNYYEESRLVSMIDALPPPSMYAKHFYFSNFSRFGVERANPIYINMVRDPVERVISWYYYIRSPLFLRSRRKDFPDLHPPRNDWLKKDYETCVLRGDSECTYLETGTNSNTSNSIENRMDGMISQVRFFCGHSVECGFFNGEWAMQKAKKNVERSYAVVGVLKHFNISLQVFEAYIPRFFRGVSDIYHEKIEQIRVVNKNDFKPSVSEFVKNIVRKNFTREIEFYKFCQQRLWMQYVALQMLKTTE